ncbi:MAG: ATP-binding protein [Thermodesulfobacteriota bacterium]
MKNIFIHTRNVTTFLETMKEADKAHGAPVLLVFYGPAGRGKTATTRWFAAQNGAIYYRAKIKLNDLWFLQGLCQEVGLRKESIPHRRQWAYEAIVERLRQSPRPVLIDEADKLDTDLLERVRDLADETYAPFALIGEERIVSKMAQEKRIWRRTLRVIEFEPVAGQDVLFLAKEGCDLKLTAGQAEMFRAAADGDFGVVERDLRRLEELVRVNPGQNEKLDDDLVAKAIKQGLRGKSNGR